MHNGARSKDAGRGERGAAARAAHRAAGEAGGGAGGGGPLVTVPGVQGRVPGSTSNVGAGFDCVGRAIVRRLTGTEARLTAAPLEVHGSLVCVFAAPDFAVETEQARAPLPSTVSRRTAATAAAKAAALVAGLARADAPLLAAALDDVLHAPHRRSL